MQPIGAQFTSSSKTVVFPSASLLLGKPIKRFIRSSRSLFAAVIGLFMVAQANQPFTALFCQRQNWQNCLAARGDTLNFNKLGDSSSIIIAKLNWHPRSIKCELLALALQLCNIYSLRDFFFLSKRGFVMKGLWINALKVAC